MFLQKKVYLENSIKNVSRVNSTRIGLCGPNVNSEYIVHLLTLGRSLIIDWRKKIPKPWEGDHSSLSLSISLSLSLSLSPFNYLTMSYDNES